MATTIATDLGQGPYMEDGLAQRYTYDFYEQQRESFEKTINVFGYIPVISTFSGTLRMVVGGIALIKHVVAAVFCSIADLFGSNSNGYGYRVFKYSAYCIHDLCNVIRGGVELFPLAGNLITFIYDFALGRFSYAVEYTGVHYPKWK
jgi:hypothetical protein